MFNSKFTSLETYLAQIAYELRALPSQARADEMREIESHLRAMIEGRQQIEEISAAEATMAALKQFGAPHSIGRKLRRAWERKQSEPWWRAIAAPLAGTVFFAILSLVIQAAVDILSPAQFATIIASGGAPMLIFGMYFLLGAGLFLMGFVMGYISPKRGLLIFLLLVAVFSTIGIWPTIATKIDYSGINYTLLLPYIYGLVAVLFGIQFGARRSRKRSIAKML